MLVRGNVGHADLRQIIHRRAETDGFRDGGSPGFEFVRNRIRAEGTQFDFLDHVAAAQKWRHGFQQLNLSIQHTDAGRAAHLVRGEGQEVRAEGLRVHRDVRDGLGRVHEGNRPNVTREADDLSRGVDRPEDVRHVGERDQLRGPRKKRAVGVHVEQAVLRHRDEV